jgi:hypothetical protein
MAPAPAVQLTRPQEENWIIQFAIASATALSTTGNAVPIYGSVQRYAGGVVVATSTTPFQLPNTQQAAVVDLYVSGAPTLDGAIDFFVEDLPQKIGLLASTVNATVSGRQRLAAPVPIRGGSPFRPAYYPIASSSAAVTQTIFAKVLIGPA